MQAEARAFPPQLYLIGAQKAGTTSLAYLLNQHPEIAVSDPKEPGFFSVNFERGWDWYRQCFPDHLPSVLLDASTGYTMASRASDLPPDSVALRIKKHAPEARFIYVLRDPVERTISAYWHDKRAGRPVGSLREAVSSVAFYTDVSRYHWQIAAYLSHFRQDQFLFVDFRALTQDPVGIARQCLRFAGLRDDVPLDLGRPRNSAFEFNSIGKMLIDLFPDERTAGRFIGAIKAATPGFVHQAAKAAMTKDPDQIGAEDRDWLASLFSLDNKRMEALVGFRFYQ